MFQSDRFWMLIVSFVTLVMKTRELHRRQERDNEDGAIKNRIRAYTTGRASRADWAAAAVKGGTFFLPWLARRVG